MSIEKFSIVLDIDEPLKFVISCSLNAMKIHVPLVKLLKIPLLNSHVAEALRFGERKRVTHTKNEKEDTMFFLSSMLTIRNNNPNNISFFISFIVDDLIFHICMFYSGAPTNVMTLSVMSILGLHISRSNKNICSMESRKVKVSGVVAYVLVYHIKNR